MNALEEKVLELIGEDPEAPDVFADTDEGMRPIRESISDAIQEIVMVTGGNKRQYFIPLRSEQGFYRLRLQGCYFGWVTDGWLVNQRRRLEQTDLIRLSTYDPRWMVHTGNPEAYLQIGSEIIGVYPRPSGNADMVELSMVVIPETYTNDRDRIRLRRSFQNAVVHFAVGEFWASRGDAMEATKHHELYLEALGLKNKYLPQSERRFEMQTTKERHPVITS